MHSWTNQSKAAYLDGKWNVIYIHKLPKLNSLSYGFHLCLDVCLAKIEVKADWLETQKGKIDKTSKICISNQLEQSDY